MGELRDIARGEQKPVEMKSFGRFTFDVLLLSVGMGLVVWGILMALVIHQTAWWLYSLLVVLGVVITFFGFRRAGTWVQATLECALGLVLFFVVFPVWGSMWSLIGGIFFVVIGFREFRSNLRMLKG